MEEQLGNKLFNRDNRSVNLTHAGILFKDYADDVISRWYDLQNKLSTDEVLRGEISLYCSVTAVYSILPKMLGKFREIYPQIHINLQTGDAAMALLKLQNGEVDISIAAFQEHAKHKIIFKKMIETPLVFIGPRRFPETVVYDKGEINWHKTPIIMAKQGLGRKRVEQWFSGNGIIPDIYAQVAGNEAIIAMVSLGCGIGIVPQLVLEKNPFHDQVKILNITPRLKPFNVGLCTLEKNLKNPVVQSFWTITEYT
jgi:LysR family positive regulator for ilvC